MGRLLLIEQIVFVVLEVFRMSHIRRLQSSCCFRERVRTPQYSSDELPDVMVE